MDEIKMVVLFMLLYDKKFSLVYNFLKSLLIMLIDWLYHKMYFIKYNHKITHCQN